MSKCLVSLKHSEKYIFTTVIQLDALLLLLRRLVAFIGDYRLVIAHKLLSDLCVITIR